jgi:hypothetical protein
MRFLTRMFAVTALRRGRPIEQFLGGIEAGERQGIRWISLSPGSEGISVYLHEVEDIGSDTFWDLTEFPPLNPDDETRGLIGVATTPEEAIEVAEHDLGADPGKWVSHGHACDEYADYRATVHDNGGVQPDLGQDAQSEAPTWMSFTWSLSGHGWVTCTVADASTQAQAIASYITAAPEELLTAVVRLIAGEKQTRAQFEAEPDGHRWIFHREADEVRLQLLHLADSGEPDKAGTEIWSSRQTIDTLARSIIRGFDEALTKYGESAYQARWGAPFPRAELRALRNAWKRHRPPTQQNR